MTLGTTPSQTVGPFFSIGLPWPDGPFVVPEGSDGAIWLRGRVVDGDGEPVPDAIVETWQADPKGRFDHPDDPRGAVSGFRGFGRSATDAEGEWAILTLKPGPVPGPDDAAQAPHIAVTVLARGLLNRVVTRIYFPDELEANAADSILATLVDDPARSTLLAQRSDDGYRFDVHLQGPDETLFFSL